MNIYNFSQIIDSPTRITQTSSTLIDLALMFSSLTCTEKGALDPFCSDHCPIFMSTSFVQVPKPCYSRKIWSYDRGNYDLFRNTLRESNLNIDNISIDESALLFKTNISQAADHAIPNKTAIIRPSDPPWMHTEVRKEIRTRNKMHKTAKSRNDDVSWAVFRTQRNKVNN